MGMLSLSTKADDAKQSLSRCTAEQKHRRVAKEQKQEDCRYLLKTHAMQYLLSVATRSLHFYFVGQGEKAIHVFNILIDLTFLTIR